MVTLENWKTAMGEDMQLRDFRPRTQQSYMRIVRLFLRWADCGPEAVTDTQVRAYFLYLRQECKQAPSTINVAVCALRFFCKYTLHRDWPVFELLRVKQPRKLPVVLSTHEVRAVLGAVRHPVVRVALFTIYALGLRLGEGLSLQTGHIDAGRLMVWVRDGKGGKDRAVPLPRPLLRRLRHYWRDDRPSCGDDHLFVAARSQAPLHKTTMQKTFSAALKQTAIGKRASIHTLRHSYATHLLEAGISLRTIQAVLGHKSMRTTEVYMHVTKPGTEHLQEVLDKLMVGL